MARLGDMLTGVGGGVSLAGGGLLILGRQEMDGCRWSLSNLVTGGCQAWAAGPQVLWYGLQAALTP